MKILIVDRNLPIPAIKYGGTERVIWCLGKELAKMGHEVSFLVPKGSKCDFAKIVELNKEEDISSQIPEGIDIVHLNFPCDEEFKTPRITTLHGYLIGSKLDINTVFISKKHAEIHGAEYYIHHGLDWSEYNTYAENVKKRYYHFLGKANWGVKNVNKAMKVATKAKVDLHILGGEKYNFRNFKRNFNYFFNKSITYHGMVGGDEKFNLLQQSKGLIFPVRWHEPFGLAMIESLYYGSPVFGSKYGSLPEIITNEVGFLSNNSEEIIQAIKNNNYSSKLCNEYAVEKFNSKRMAEEYVKAYEIILNKGKLNTKILKQITTKGAIDILPFD